MKKRVIIVVLIVALLIAAHFVPIYQRIGYLSKDSNNLCVGYSAPNEYSKHVILNGFKSPRGFEADPNAAHGSGQTCAEPVKLRYYLM